VPIYDFFVQVRKGQHRYFDRWMMPGYQPRVPQQPNNCDCGVYSIQYAESFFNSPLKSYHFPISSLWNWFSESSMQTKRKEIYDSIIDLINKKYPENAIFVPKLSFETEEDPKNDAIDGSAGWPMETDENRKSENADPGPEVNNTLCTTDEPLNHDTFSQLRSCNVSELGKV